MHSNDSWLLSGSDNCLSWWRLMMVDGWAVMAANNLTRTERTETVNPSVWDVQTWHKIGTAHSAQCSPLGILDSDINHRDCENPQLEGTFICFLEVFASLQPWRRFVIWLTGKLIKNNLNYWKILSINQKLGSCIFMTFSSIPFTCLFKWMWVVRISL